MCRSSEDVEPLVSQDSQTIVNQASSFRSTKSTVLSFNRPSQNQNYQSFFIVRHGHRQDEEDPDWPKTTDRPWDPPLSAQGRVEAKRAADRFKDWNIDIIVCSPFLRCLQTSAEIVSVLKLPPTSWIVAWNLAEVCMPSYLFLDDTTADQYRRQSIDKWMWQGKGISEAISDFANQERAITGIEGTPSVWEGLSPPHWPEKMADGEKRFMKALKSIESEFSDKTVLVVTHGDALRTLVTENVAGADVKAVKHLGYIPLVRQAFQGRWGPWRLGAESGSTGVDWDVKKQITI